MASLSQQHQLQLGSRWALVTKWLANSWRMVGVALLCMHVSVVHGQPLTQRIGHDQQMPPGAIGHRQLLRSESLREYYIQPVRLTASDGALIASYDGSESIGEYNVLNVGLQVGSVYRFRVSEIPNLDDRELYPSVEVVDRLYPPANREQEFPIPIELTRVDLELAANGKYVTRVVYIEDPDDPFPYDEANLDEVMSRKRAATDEQQRYFEVPAGEDPYVVAAGLGRPVAILRIGDRAPNLDGDNHEFTFGSQTAERLANTRIQGSVPRAILLGDAQTSERDAWAAPNRTTKKPARSLISRVSALLPNSELPIKVAPAKRPSIKD